MYKKSAVRFLLGLVVATLFLTLSNNINNTYAQYEPEPDQTITYNFNEFAPGSVWAYIQYPYAKFYAYNSYLRLYNFVRPPNVTYPNFLSCDYPEGFGRPGVIFNQPIHNLSFSVIGGDGGSFQVDIYKNSQFSQTLTLPTTCPSVACFVDLRSHTNVTGVDMHSINDVQGVGFDDFSFTLGATPAPTPTPSSTPARPIGNFDLVTPDGIAKGWTLDPNDPSVSNLVHFYIDGLAVPNYAGQVIANIPGPHGNHSFEFSIPAQFRDGADHTIYAYGLDLMYGSQPPTLLPGSPKTFNIKPPVQSVAFEQITNETINGELTNSVIDIPAVVIDSPSQRIFPDRKFPADTVNHKRVKVRAVVGKPNVTVYFKNYDVDDPTNDVDNVIDDNGSLGNDNREGRTVFGEPQSNPSGAGILSAPSAVTNANGEAVVYFTVTKQPGDNFRVAASTDEQYLNGVVIDGTSLKDSTGVSLSTTTEAKQTNLLTVWRRIHLEVDSMGTAGGNHINGSIPYDNFDVGQQPVWVNLFTRTGNMEVGRYRKTLGPNGETLRYGGRLKMGEDNLQVLDNTVSSVLVRSESGIVEIRPSYLFALFDDDDFNSNDGLLWRGDDGEDISELFDTRFLLQESDDINANPYAEAYIKPDYAWAANAGLNNTNVPFESHYPYTPPNFDQERDKIDSYRDSKNTPTVTFERDDFWVGYVLVAYQSNSALDNDPQQSPQNGRQHSWQGGVAPPIDYTAAWADGTLDSRQVQRGSVGAIIYIEAMRDFDTAPNLFPPGFPHKSRIRTMPHELGHQFGLKGDNDNPDFGIMSDEGVGTLLRFNPGHINIMRWRIKSPGE